MTFWFSSSGRGWKNDGRRKAFVYSIIKYIPILIIKKQHKKVFVCAFLTPSLTLFLNYIAYRNKKKTTNSLVYVCICCLKPHISSSCCLHSSCSFTSWSSHVIYLKQGTEKYHFHKYYTKNMTRKKERRNYYENVFIFNWCSCHLLTFLLILRLHTYYYYCYYFPPEVSEKNLIVHNLFLE